MGANDKSFLTENISKLLFKFAIPAILSSLVYELYNTVDTVFAGRYVGTEAIGAVTIAYPIQKLMIAIGLLIASGTLAYAARALGERNIKELKSVIVNSLILTLISLITVSILIYFFRKPVIYAIGASDKIYVLADKYVSILLIGGVFQALAIVACYIMISFGKARIILYTNIIGISLDIIFSYILVVVCGMGLTGSAVANITAQVISFAFALFMFVKTNNQFKIKFSKQLTFKCVNKSIIWEIITVGFSTFIIEMVDAFVGAVLNNILHPIGGDSAIIIVGIVTKVLMIMFIAVIGISSGMQPIISYNFGAGNYKRVKNILKCSIKYIVSISTVFWIVFMKFSYPIIGFFLKDKALLDQTVSSFRTCVLLVPLLGVYYVTIYYYQAIGEARKSFLLSIYREIVIFIPLATLFIKIFGMKGAFIAYPTGDVIVILTSLYFIRKAFKEKFEEEKVSKHVVSKSI
ncbi:MATE family efflux transporter [Clostridium neuense]|uniref:Multidrug export protein MepA n=1 Tax=Clostridium neuense TaxID=1728934 RepID=A0ABW8TLG7_9CLOT